MRNVGLDLGVRKIAFCEVVDGKVVARCEVTSIDKLVDKIGPGTPPARVVFEACRTAWYIHDVVTGWGHDAVLVDTTRGAQIGIRSHGKKNDRIDAEHLARAAEGGRIPVAHVLSHARQELRHEVMLRQYLVETRTKTINMLRGQLLAEGLPLTQGDADDVLSKVVEAELPERLRRRLAPAVAVLGAVEQQLAVVDAALEDRCERDADIQRLMTIPRVGVVLAAAFVSVIDDASRFRSAAQVASYLGLVPKENSSGDRAQLGHITRAGNAHVRTLLVQAAHGLLTRRQSAADAEDALRNWGLDLLARRKRQVAVVAVARRLARIMWAIWRSGTTYDPVRPAAASARGLALDQTTRDELAPKLDSAKKKLRKRKGETASRARRTQELVSPPSAPTPSKRSPRRAA